MNYSQYFFRADSTRELPITGTARDLAVGEFFLRRTCHAAMPFSRQRRTCHAAMPSIFSISAMSSPSDANVQTALQSMEVGQGHMVAGRMVSLTNMEKIENDDKNFRLATEPTSRNWQERRCIRTTIPLISTLK